MDLTSGDRPVFQHLDSGNYLFFHPGISQWLFGPDITTTSYYFRNEVRTSLNSVNKFSINKNQMCL